MPRLIDHEQRRRELAEAVWRVIVRDGVGAVSVRTVAAEAGVSTGSLRHVLPAKSEMLDTAMALAIDNASARFLNHSSVVDSVADAVDWLSELLPLDEQRRVELEIQLALVAEAGGQPDLQARRDEAAAGIREACLSVLRVGVDSRLFRRNLDLDAEATRLHVLLDGLAFHLIGGGDTPPDLARELLAEHLSARARR